MTIKSARPRRRLWRIALALLVVLPFLPEIAIFAIAGLARARGCLVDQDWVCHFAGIRVSDMIANALDAGLLVAAAFGTGVAAAWLALCYATVTLGWARLSSRLLLAILVSAIFSFLPYFGPLLAVGALVNPHCHPNEGGVGPCVIFGGNVGEPAHEAVAAPWFVFVGAPIALGAFVIYAVAVIIIRFVSRRGKALSTQ